MKNKKIKNLFIFSTVLILLFSITLSCSAVILQLQDIDGDGRISFAEKGVWNNITSIHNSQDEITEEITDVRSRLISLRDSVDSLEKQIERYNNTFVTIIAILLTLLIIALTFSIISYHSNIKLKKQVLLLLDNQNYDNKTVTNNTLKSKLKNHSTGFRLFKNVIIPVAIVISVSLAVFLYLAHHDMILVLFDQEITEVWLIWTYITVTLCAAELILLIYALPKGNNKTTHDFQEYCNSPENNRTPGIVEKAIENTSQNDILNNNEDHSNVTQDVNKVNQKHSNRALKIIICIIVVLLYGVLSTLLNSSGIILGAIPTFALVGFVLWIINKSNKKIDNLSSKKDSKDNSINSETTE